MEDFRHVAARPSWTCRACGAAWPCPPAREHLTRTLEPTGLAMYMWANFEEAILLGHLTETSSPSAFDRFIGWMRPARQPEATEEAKAGGIPAVERCSLFHAADQRNEFLAPFWRGR